MFIIGKFESNSEMCIKVTKHSYVARIVVLNVQLTVRLISIYEFILE